jgi:hypothetical protein
MQLHHLLSLFFAAAQHVIGSSEGANCKVHIQYCMHPAARVIGNSQVWLSKGLTDFSDQRTAAQPALPDY